MQAGTIVNRETLIALVLESLADVLRLKTAQVEVPLGEDTPLLGRGAVIDSLGLVTLIVEIEQRLEERHRIVVTLADERAMSYRHSPFRTVGTLSDHVLRFIGRGADGGP